MFANTCALEIHVSWVCAAWCPYHLFTSYCTTWFNWLSKKHIQHSKTCTVWKLWNICFVYLPFQFGKLLWWHFLKFFFFFNLKLEKCCISFFILIKNEKKHPICCLWDDWRLHAVVVHMCKGERVSRIWTLHNYMMCTNMCNTNNSSRETVWPIVAIFKQLSHPSSRSDGCLFTLPSIVAMKHTN